MHHGVLALPPLRHNKQHDEDDKTHERANDCGVAPALCCATPLHSKNEAHDRTDDENNADDIQLTEHATPVRTTLRWLVDEEQENEKAGYGTNRKVDVKATQSLSQASQKKNLDEERERSLTTIATTRGS